MHTTNTTHRHTLSTHTRTNAPHPHIIIIVSGSILHAARSVAPNSPGPAASVPSIDGAWAPRTASARIQRIKPNVTTPGWCRFPTRPVVSVQAIVKHGSLYGLSMRLNEVIILSSSCSTYATHPGCFCRCFFCRLLQSGLTEPKKRVFLKCVLSMGPKVC